jgi:hypothetical protein
MGDESENNPEEDAERAGSHVGGAESDGNKSSDEETYSNASADEESDDDFQDPSPRSSSQKSKKPTRRQRWNDTESVTSVEDEMIDEEALSGFGTNVKTGCTTVGRTKRDIYINGYGDKGSRIYKLEDQPHHGCKVDNLDVINASKMQLGMLKDEETEKWIYTRRHVAAVYGVAFQDDIENGVYGPESLNPNHKNDRRWSDMYVWIGWRDPVNPKIVNRSWETRTTARRLWRKKTDMMLYLAAWEAEKRYNEYKESGVRATSRDVTPGLIQNYIAQQRELSVPLEIPRQPSVPGETVMPSIETDNTQNRPRGANIQNQPGQSTNISSNQSAGQTQILRLLQSMQSTNENLYRAIAGLRI